MIKTLTKVGTEGTILNINKTIYDKSTAKKIMDLENRLVVAPRGGRGNGRDWELGVNGCKLWLLEWISNEILLCSTENYVYILTMQQDNGRKNYVYMYV